MDQRWQESMTILDGADVIDLHQESFIWTRVLGYDLTVAHSAGPLLGNLMCQADLPRLLSSGLTGTVQSIATNPLKIKHFRTSTLQQNIQRLHATIDTQHGFRVVTSLTEYRQARVQGDHGCFIAIQGANALTHPRDIEKLAPSVSRITLVHMSDSNIGRTSNPLGGFSRPPGLTTQGRELVEAMNARRIIVDLAHIDESGFRVALDVHDRTIPPIVSHTGIRGAHPSWRNLADWQIEAIAERGGVVGIFAHAWALAPPLTSVTTEAVVAHMQHAINVGGQECVALGTDFDGFIIPPADMKTVDRLGALVTSMLERGFTHETIRAVMGGNAARVIGAVRP